MRVLPKPSANAASSVQVDLAQIEFVYPELREARLRELTATEWEQLVTRFRAGYAKSMLQWGSDEPTKLKIQKRLVDADSIRQGDDVAYPAAAAFWRKRNTDREEAMPDRSVVLNRYYWAEYSRLMNQYNAAFTLPYEHRLPALEQLDREIEGANESQPANPFLVGVPLLYKYALTGAIADRMIAALIVVEAIRDYAASHDGQLPQTLNEIELLPIPDNPLTGKSFDYRVEDGIAILSDPIPVRHRTAVWKVRLNP